MFTRLILLAIAAISCFIFTISPIAQANSYLTGEPTIYAQVIERHQLDDDRWNLLIKIISADDSLTGWVVYDRETDLQNWKFFDVDHDETHNLELIEYLEVKNTKPNSNFLQTQTLAEINYKLVRPLSEESRFTNLSIFGEEVNPNRRQAPFGLVPDRRYWSLRCLNFIDQQGYIQNWGETVIATINRYPEYFGELVSDVPSYCPNFPKMQKAEKEAFWIWLFAAMSMRESSCDPSNRSRGPNGTAAGLLQLHLHKEAAYHRDCANTHALNPNENLSCGGAMLDGQFLRYGRLFLSKGSYWEVLQTDSSGAGVRKLLSFYRPCF